MEQECSVGCLRFTFRKKCLHVGKALRNINEIATRWEETGIKTGKYIPHWRVVDKWEDLLHVPGCYVWQGSDDLCWYVGRSMDIRRRHYEHAKGYGVTKTRPFKNVKRFWYCTTCYYYDLEVELLILLQPLFTSAPMNSLGKPLEVTKYHLDMALKKVHPLGALL